MHIPFHIYEIANGISVLRITVKNIRTPRFLAEFSSAILLIPEAQLRMNLMSEFQVEIIEDGLTSS